MSNEIFVVNLPRDINFLADFKSRITAFMWVKSITFNLKDDKLDGTATIVCESDDVARTMTDFLNGAVYKDHILQFRVKE